MKYSVAILILILPALSFAQVKKVRIDTTVINELIASWSLGFSESGTEPPNIRTFNKFKSLFSPDAVVDDEINAVYNPQSDKDPNPYKTFTKPVDVYAHDLTLNFKSLLVDTVYDISYDTDSLRSDSIYRVTLIKTMSGEKYRQYIFKEAEDLTDDIMAGKLAQHRIKGMDRERILERIKDQINDVKNRTFSFRSTNHLLVRMQMKNDTIFIISITNSVAPESIHCVNDDDDDGVIDEEDACRKSLADLTARSRGDLTARGCLDDDLDGIPNDADDCPYIYGSAGNHGCPADYFVSHLCLSGFAGVQTNSAQLNMPDLNQLGYSELDHELSREGVLENPGTVISPFIGAEVSYYFGSGKKKFGVSLGANYTKFSASYEISDSAVYTFKSYDGADYYRRMITLHTGTNEKIYYEALDFPLLFKYRSILGKDNGGSKPHRWDFELGVGPSYIRFNNSSTYHSNLSYEGLYQVDTLNHNGFVYYDHFYPGSSWNIRLTSNGINSQSAIPGDSTLFAELNKNGYDFYSHKIDSGEDNEASRAGVAMNFKFDLCYRIGGDERTALVIGVNALFAPMPDKSSGYIPFDKSSDPYHSVYDSKTNGTYFSLGLHLGMILRF